MRQDIRPFKCKETISLALVRWAKIKMIRPQV
jgi:hypothetical protein